MRGAGGGGARAFGGRRAGTETACSAGTVTPIPPPIPAARLLIVDDEEPILFALREYFTARRWEVDCATERAEAEALIASRNYAALIADLRLAGDGHDGLELVGYATGRSPATHVVVLTAYGSPEVELAARRRGAQAFLHKPIPLAELERVVAGLVSAYQSSA